MSAAKSRCKKPLQKAMVYHRRTVLNLHSRAEALGMLRRGSDENTVSATLNLPPADVTLSRQVSQFLCAARE
jgi:hypothetical protein